MVVQQWGLRNSGADMESCTSSSGALLTCAHPKEPAERPPAEVQSHAVATRWWLSEISHAATTQLTRLNRRCNQKGIRPQFEHG